MRARDQLPPRYAVPDIQGSRDPNIQGVVRQIVHYQGPPGTMTGVLCGWEGGGHHVETDEPADCKECIAIVAYFRKLWFPRLSKKERVNA